ncbi:MAG: hypothetical protein QGI24_06560, partial [Kiritimatiellia bacterium]|nr:hypothetical protein [Kiritimatiellia bacterium]MDP6848433.1 hypothetical protein [Kiritimatiellia bacterium]
CCGVRRTRHFGISLLTLIHITAQMALMHSGAKLGKSMSDVLVILGIVVIDGFLPFTELRRK